MNGLPSCEALGADNTKKSDFAVGRNQWTALHVASKEGLNDKQTIALFEAAFVESGFHNWANPKVSSSLQHQNDGIPATGGDLDSVGVLQQRVNWDGSGNGRGWGEVAKAMDPTKAMTEFASRVKGVPNQEVKTSGQLAQAVQVSAFPNRYDEKFQDATDLYARMLKGCIK